MQQRGFTLIELIIVVIILGILAVTAAPRFLDLTDEARTSTMQGIYGAVKSTTQISRAALLLNERQTVQLEGVTVQFVDNDASPAVSELAANGYPHAEEVCALAGLSQIDGTAAAGQVGVSNAEDAGDSISCTVTGTTLVISDTAAPTPANCTVTYVEAASANSAPAITINTAGCTG